MSLNKKQYTWKRKANTATVITQDSVLIVESLFPTFVKTTNHNRKKKFCRFPELYKSYFHGPQTNCTVDFVTKHFQPRVPVCLV